MLRSIIEKMGAVNSVLNLRKGNVGMIMEAWEKRLLQRNYSFLLRSLDPECIRVALVGADLLTPNENQQISAQKIPMEANELILDALKRRAPGTLEEFCIILEKEGGHKHVLDRLKPGRFTVKTFS